MNRLWKLLVLGLALGTLPLWAHTLAVWAELRENRVWVEVYSTEGDPVSKVPVTIEDPNGQILLQATTDEKGKFDFAPTSKVGLVVCAALDEHHKSSFTLTAADLKDAVIPTPTP